MDNEAYDSNNDESCSNEKHSRLSTTSPSSSSTSLPSLISSSTTTTSNQKIRKIVEEPKPYLINVQRDLLYTKQIYSLHHQQSEQCIQPTNECNCNLNNFKNLENDDDESNGKNGLKKKKKRSMIGKFFSQKYETFRSTYDTPSSVIYTLFPITKWIRYYNVRDDLLSDIITGFTILALHIPQGLAYGRLAGARPINGLYVSLFPVIMYAIFGGSRHISIGTFAVISIVCNSVVENFAAPTPDHDVPITISPLLNGTNNNNGTVSDLPSAIEVLTSLAMLVGVIQFIVGTIRLGVLAILLSDPIVSSFCVGAACHVFTSQVFAILSVENIPISHEHLIPFPIVVNWSRILSQFAKINWYTFALSLGTIAVLAFTKNFLEPWLMKRFKLKTIAIPIDIIMIIILTFLSYLFNWNDTLSVPTIPKLHSGFKNMPLVPRIDLWPRLVTSAAMISFISYAGTFSLEKIYARKHGYEVYPNQELLAMGIANFFASFFQCYPCSGSLARTAVQDKVGGRTQLATIISSILIFIFISFLSHLLETLPKFSLSCIIMVALVPTFKRSTDLIRFWKMSKLDGVLWVVTVTFVIFAGVDSGLLFGVIVGLLLTLFRLAMPSFNMKHHIAGTECYATIGGENDSNPHTNGCLIFEFHGPLIFLNVERFKSCFTDQILTIIRRQMEMIRDRQQNQLPMPRKDSNAAKMISVINCEKQSNGTKPIDQTIIHSIIFDMSYVSYCDGKAGEALFELDFELKKMNEKYQNLMPIQFYLASINVSAIDTLVASGFFDKFPNSLKRCFITVHDAVMYATNPMEAHNDRRNGSLIHHLN